MHSTACFSITKELKKPSSERKVAFSQENDGRRVRNKGVLSNFVIHAFSLSRHGDSSLRREPWVKRTPLSAHGRENYIKPVGATITPLRYVSRTSSCWSSARAQSNLRKASPLGKLSSAPRETDEEKAGVRYGYLVS